MMNKLSYPRTTIFLITLWLAGMIGLLVVNPTLFFVILEKELWIANIVSILVFIMGTIDILEIWVSWKALYLSNIIKLL